MSYLNLENSLIEDRYLVRRRMRHGSYAELFLAHDQKTETDVVIKALNVQLKGTPDHEVERKLLDYFQNEAEALDTLRHPNIITRLGHGTAADLDGRLFHYLVLEYMAGGDLMRLCRDHPLGLKQALDYCHQVCRGLDYAHQHGIIHRDVKPQNLLLTGDLKIVKITDFGIAKVLREDDEEEVTRGIGTETYAPPECFGCQPSDVELTPSADIYGLAKTLYVLVTGVSPRQYLQKSITELPAHLHQQPWAGDLSKIMSKATQDSPQNRYLKIEEFWRDLSVLTQSVETLELSEEEEDTIIAVKIDGPNFSRPVDQEHRSKVNDHALKARGLRDHVLQGVEAHSQPMRSAVRVEVPIEGLPTPRPPSGLSASTEAPLAEAKPEPSPTANRRWSRRLFVLGLAASFVAASLGLHAVFSRSQANPLMGVVTARNLNLRSGPGEGYSSHGWIPGGTRVKILGLSEDGYWFEVEVVYWDGEKFDIGRGWVGKAFIEIIQEETR